LNEWEKISALSESSVGVCIEVYAQCIWFASYFDFAGNKDSSKNHLKRPSSTSAFGKSAKQSTVSRVKNTTTKKDTYSLLSSWDTRFVVFLSNIAFGTSEEHVLEAFKTCKISCGLGLQPEHVILARNEKNDLRGFGHAMFDEEQKAKLAIQKLDRKIRVDGRPLFLSVYQPVPRSERVSSAPVYPKDRDGYTLFLSKIHPGVRRESEIASALGIRIVDFQNVNSTVESAPDVVDQMDEDIADIPKKPVNVDLNIEGSSKNEVGNDDDATIRRTKESEKPAAQVRLVFTPDGHFKGVAYVQFEREEDAVKIFERFKDDGLLVRNSKVRVQMSDPQGARNRSFSARMLPRAVATRKTKVSIDSEHSRES
jgi:RNA recognition motif-containing protein